MNNEEERSVKLIDYFLQNPEDMKKLSVIDRRDLLRLGYVTAEKAADRRVKEKCCELLYSCCFNMELDIKEMWQIYWKLKFYLFQDALIMFSGHLDSLYRRIFLKIKSMIPDTYPPYQEGERSNVIVIVTDQMLEIGHAPTRRVLDYAWTINTALNKAVVIVNSAGLNYYFCRCFEGDIGFNFLEELNGIEKINYNGVTFPFMQLTEKMPDIYSMSEALDIVYNLKPELVYNIGGSSIFADLCGMFTKTCCFPCSNDIPITMSQYLLVGRKLSEADSERLSRLEDYQQIVETVVNYKLPAMGQNLYNREKFGLSGADFVFGIVGNRLDTEISDEFIELMDRLLLDLDIHILIIGGIQKPERIKETVSFPDKIHIAGKLEDAVFAIKLLDVYLNPYRSGGGRSSFEALAQGVPVITFKYGDVYYTCGDEFAVGDDENLLETASRYVTDGSFMENQKHLALKRADSLSDIASTQKEALDKILNS